MGVLYSPFRHLTFRSILETKIHHFILVLNTMTIFLWMLVQRTTYINVFQINLVVYTGWPRKNATLTINDFKKTRDRINELCPLLRIKFFFQKDDTKIINFDEGVWILWPFFWGNIIFKICHFCLKSHNWRTENFHCLAPPGKCLLCKTKTAWIKRSIHYVILQCYNPGKALKEIPHYLNRDFWYMYKGNFENDIASEKWL